MRANKIEEMKYHQKICFVTLCCFLIACGPKVAGDQTIATDIQAKLYANDLTRASQIKVAVADGVVSLSGNVPNADTALQAMTIANGESGIKSVNNQMTVATAGVTLPPSQDLSTPAAAGPAYSGPATAPPQTAATLPPPPPPAASVPVPLPAPEPAVEKERPPRNEPVSEEPRTVTIPAGINVAVRMIDSIDTGHNEQGQTFRASLSAPLTIGDRVIVPVGTPATILLAESRSAGRVKGRSELELRLTSIMYHGEGIHVSSGEYEAKGGSRGKQTAIRTGIGAAAGALIGGLAGGGKGAGIGSLAGGGAGAGFQLLTHGQQIKIPSETEINFRLQDPLILRR